MIESNWYVITGGVSSGKSTLLLALKQNGYKVVKETARAVIDEELTKGKAIGEVRGNDQLLQQKIFARMLERESHFSRDEIIFFDRGLPDCAAYHKNCGLDPKEVLDVCLEHRYKGIFFMEQLPFEKDHIRTETKQQFEKITRLLIEMYEKLGYELTFVPVCQ